MPTPLTCCASPLTTRSRSTSATKPTPTALLASLCLLLGSLSLASVASGESTPFDSRNGLKSVRIGGANGNTHTFTDAIPFTFDPYLSSPPHEQDTGIRDRATVYDNATDAAAALEAFIAANDATDGFEIDSNENGTFGDESGIGGDYEPVSENDGIELGFLYRNESDKLAAKRIVVTRSFTGSGTTAATSYTLTVPTPAHRTNFALEAEGFNENDLTVLAGSRGERYWLAYSDPTYTPSGPFQSCPEDAFLVQTRAARFYGIDLGSGNYRQLHATTGMGSINAMGFSIHDQYLYAWDKDNTNLIRIDARYSIEQMTLTQPVQSHYFVGDVSVLENAFYMYKRNQNTEVGGSGFWRIDLDPESTDYLTPVLITEALSPELHVHDIAFHPFNGLAYTVELDGDLYSIDPSSGATTELSNLGLVGPFGATYFDVGGNLYISQNQTGRIYAIDLTETSPTANYFSQGPASSQNDGARCALASVPEQLQTLWDFGDAPNSYGTSMSGNGARHQESDSGVFLGRGVDFETQAMNGTSQSDEGVISLDDFGDASIRETGDEDGVTFVTALKAGTDAIIQVEGGDTGGNLNGWIDFNHNGSFEEAEQILLEYSLSANTTENITIAVPSDAENGLTWARFRIASLTGIQAVGGAADGEVEDYQVSVAGQSNIVYYPSSNDTVSVAFEDLWPGQGDYDLNDFIVRMRTGQEIGSGQTYAIIIEGDVSAVGAGFRNGFAVRIDELDRSKVVEGTIEFEINGETVSASPLEEGTTKAVFVVVDNIWDFVEPAEGCTYYRTELDCGDALIQFEFSLRAELTDVAEGTIASSVFNPFIFATPGFGRGSLFSSPPGRSLEIHMKNESPSSLADPGFFGLGDDASNPTQGLTYLTETGLPWAIETGSGWKHPAEEVDLLDAYPDFADFVLSQGQEKLDWFTNPVESKVYPE